MDSVITQVTKDSMIGPSGDIPSSTTTNGTTTTSIITSSIRRRLLVTNTNGQQEPNNSNSVAKDVDGKTTPTTSSSSPTPSRKSNFFRKLLNCWCCGRSRRRQQQSGGGGSSRSGGEPTAPETVSTDDEHNHTHLPYTNGGGGTTAAAGDNQHYHQNQSSEEYGLQQGQHSPPPGGYLLPSVHSDDCHKPCMVIDLDETLVHSSFKPIGNADFIVPVEIDGVIHQVYVAKRPYVDEFLQKMGQLYECVLFTASLAKYADPVADLLDKWGVFRSRLFRDACVFHRGNYVKDLNKLGRPLQRVVIVDNSPASYIFHPDNAVPVGSWFDDSADTELLYLIPFFERLSSVDNVYTVLRNSNHPFNTTTTPTTSPLKEQGLPTSKDESSDNKNISNNKENEKAVGVAS